MREPNEGGWMSHRPYVTATQHELPFIQLSHEQFERLCLRLVQARGYQAIEHLGRSGSEQGRDIVAWDGVTRVAVQCKRVQTFGAADGLIEIRKLLTLDPTMRPHRVIFMVTCNISSRARAQIRQAWSGDKRSVEFVAASELDDEVRRNDAILREFFHLPSIMVPAIDRGKETSPEALDELEKTESYLRDWILIHHTIQFQRLLKAIRELEHSGGRLEAGRALQFAIQSNNAHKLPTESNLLRACIDLDANPMFQLDWTLRRTLSRVIGDLLGQLGPKQYRTVGAFCEPRLNTRRGLLLLAEAASEHTASALAVGGPVLSQLLFSDHPQAIWQLLRRWPLVSPVMLTKFDINQLSEIGSASTKRMLFLIRLYAERDSPRSIRILLRAAARHPMSPRSDDLDVPFQRALKQWTALNTTVESSRRKSLGNSSVHIEDLLPTAAWGSSAGSSLVMQIADAVELDSIERDLRNSVGGFQPHPNERYSEGRYGYTRFYVRWAIRVTPSELISALLLEFLRCADEGIRWAVAAEVRSWWMRVPDRDAAFSVVALLVDDEHPWVVRETLQQLGTDPLLSQAIGVEYLTHRAELARQRAEAEGWDTDELMAAIRRVAGHMPP